MMEHRFAGLERFRPLLRRKIDGCAILPNVDLSKRTTMRVQARTAVHVEATTIAGLREVVLMATGNNWPLMVLGGGANTLFAASYFDGIVVSLSGIFKERSLVSPLVVEAGAALPLPTLLTYVKQCNLMGLEFLTNVPGQVGGSLAGNAGAGGYGLCEFAESVTFLTRSGRIVTVGRTDYDHHYRHSELHKAIVIGAEFRLLRRDERAASASVEQYKAAKTNQPYDVPSSGCIFKNPKNPFGTEKLYAGKLIEESGLKGYTIGGAQISEKHANFIVNAGAAKDSHLPLATGEDYLALIMLTQDIVRERTGIELELEVKIAGGPLSSVTLGRP